MLDGPKKKRAALAHTPPVPSYMKGLADEDEDEDDEDDDDDDRERDPDEWQDSEDEQDIPTGGNPGKLGWTETNADYCLSISRVQGAG